MIKISLAILLAGLSFSSIAQAAEEKTVPAAPPAAPADPVADATVDMSDLEKAIPYGISLLEKKDYKTFFKQFADPKMIEEMIKNGGSIDDMVKGVNPEMAEGILFAFKSLKDLKPKMEDDGKLATYTFTEDMVADHKLPNSQLVFHRVDNHWYIKN